VADAFHMPFTVMKTMIVEIGVTSHGIAATHMWYECQLNLNHQIIVVVFSLLTSHVKLESLSAMMECAFPLIGCAMAEKTVQTIVMKNQVNAML
jgi:hypothetical protein